MKWGDPKIERQSTELTNISFLITTETKTNNSHQYIPPPALQLVDDDVTKLYVFYIRHRTQWMDDKTPLNNNNHRRVERLCNID